ncbi:MAG TPA: 2Fe-2S iron-sulfur cluster-binding protein [Candidatus Bilamarchaeum sp.]|nr:2Fe-2S iron-sulfur cluster-binding protein [Candidatus Bilamarchaeum sp.]
MAKVIVKNDGVTLEVPDGARLLPYLWESTSFPQGCEDGTTSICACVILRGEENVNQKNHNEIVTLQKAGQPNSSRNRLACQIYVKKGEIEIEY